MRKILLLGLTATLLTNVAHANWTLKNEGEIQDLMYISSKGKVSSQTIYSSLSTEDRTLKSIFTITNSETHLIENINYGLAEKFELGASIDYLMEHKQEIKYDPSLGGKTDTYKSGGLASIAINAKSRFLSQDTSFGNLDLKFGYSPKLGTSKDGTSTAKGNGVRGNSLLIAGLDFGRKYSDMGWRLGFTGNFYGSGKSEDAGDSTTTTTTKSYSDTLFDGTWQWLFSNKYVLNLNVGFGNLGDQDVTSGGTTSSEKSKSYTMFGLEGSYLFNPNTLLSVGLREKSYDKSEWVINNTKINTESYSDSILSLSLKTEF